MLVRECDKCRKRLNNETEFNTIVLNGQEVDLCHKCGSSILALIRCSNENMKADLNAERNNNNDKKLQRPSRNTNIKINRKTLTKEEDKKVANKVNGISVEKDTKAEDIEKRVAEIVALYNETAEQDKEKREERKAKGKQTKMDRIHEYGVEKFARGYLEGTPSIYFEELLGVTKFDIAGFVKKYKIYKTNRSHKQSKECD